MHPPFDADLLLQQPPRLLCDEMLKGLARWLRAAGYDVKMEPDGTADRRLVERAAMERRLLLTRDRTLLEIRGAPRVVVLLNGNCIDECAGELTHILNIDWLYRPFSRCLLCNTPLIEIDKPFGFPPHTEHLCICPTCDKYYWRGGHVERMSRRLKSWQASPLITIAQGKRS